MTNKTDAERFWAKVDRRGADECWTWQGSKQMGYGRFSVNDKTVKAHRYSYEMHVGPIPSNTPDTIWTIDHLCRNRACVNPDHLEVVTIGENKRRARPTHCVNGHEFTPQNSFWRKDRDWVCRGCRTCQLAACARYRAKTRA